MEKKLKVVNLNPDRTFEDRLKAIVDKHTDSLEEECTSILVIAYFKNDKILVTSDPIHTYRDLILMLKDVEIAINRDLVEEMIANAFGQE